MYNTMNASDIRTESAKGTGRVPVEKGARVSKTYNERKYYEQKVFTRTQICEILAYKRKSNGPHFNGPHFKAHPPFSEGVDRVS